MQNAGQKEDRSLSVVWANVVGFVLAIPLAAAPIAAYLWVHDLPLAAFDPAAMPLVDFGIFLLLFFAGITAHEAMHALTWIWRSEATWSDVRFGIHWRALSPYAHLKRPISASAYRWGAAMPGIVLGLLPLAAGLLAAHQPTFLFGLVFLVAAAGDILILILLRDLSPDALIEDHPERVGCYVQKKST